MTIYTLSTEKQIAAFEGPIAQVAPNAVAFETQEQLAEMVAGWPMADLVATWNKLAFAVIAETDSPNPPAPVKKFENREKAVRRIFALAGKLIPVSAKITEYNMAVTKEQVTDEQLKHLQTAAKAERKRNSRGRQVKHLVMPAAAPVGTEASAEVLDQVEGAIARHVARDMKAEAQAPARDDSKKAQALALLCRPEGATGPELMTALGWQAHTVRGFIAGTVKAKMGLAVTSTREDTGTRYHVTKEA